MALKNNSEIDFIALINIILKNKIKVTISVFFLTLSIFYAANSNFFQQLTVKTTSDFFSVNQKSLIDFELFNSFQTIKITKEKLLSLF